MDDLNLYPLDPATFRAWLLDQSGSVGVACHDGRCPLACYLEEIFGGAWLVSYTTYQMCEADVYDLVDTSALLPVWAQAFTFSVDAVADFQEGSPVSAALALSLFDGICSRLGLALPQEVHA